MTAHDATKMRAMRVRTTAAVAAAALLLPSVGALRKEAREEREGRRRTRRDLRTLRQKRREERELMHFTVMFDECVGKDIAECERLIQADVDRAPEIFEGRTSLHYEIKQIRKPDQPNYYRVGMRTNLEETLVVGVKGDGIVHYPWDWCKAPDDCAPIGPWDCDVGTPLTPDQCCNMIKASVPDPDQNGNYIDCYVDPPVGSQSNPIDYSRVLIHADGDKVVGEPRNE